MTGRSEPELLPCPFCGGVAASSVFNPPEGSTMRGNAFVQCYGCLAKSAIVFGGAAEAAIAWNRRGSTSPFPGVIRKHVHWHPGGAQCGEDGEPVPWPWPDRERYSPQIRARIAGGPDYDYWRCSRDAWPGVAWWCDPSDLDPPDFDAKGDADGTE